MYISYLSWNSKLQLLLSACLPLWRNNISRYDMFRVWRYYFSLKSSRFDPSCHKSRGTNWPLWWKRDNSRRPCRVTSEYVIVKILINKAYLVRTTELLFRRLDFSKYTFRVRKQNESQLIWVQQKNVFLQWKKKWQNKEEESEGGFKCIEIWV